MLCHLTITTLAIIIAMAMNCQKLGGYESTFVQPPPDDLLCLICTFVAKDPRQLTCCGKIFCTDCLDGLGAAQPCPHCRDDEWESFPDKRSSRNISSLKISCSKSSEGCDWTGELRVEDDHTITCEYELIECENDCLDDDGETTKILRKNLETHLQEECPKRFVECKLCNEEGEYHIITGDHLEECPEVMVECENEGCEEMIKRSERDYGTHDEVCKYEIIDCKYEPHGCDKNIKRKDMPEHEEDLKLHLEMALKTNTDLKKRLNTLEELHQSSKLKQTTLFSAVKKMDQNMQKMHGAVQHLQQSSWQKRLSTLDSVLDNEQSLAVATFKMEDYQWHVLNEKIFHSPPFYTSPGGYKMKVEVEAIENYLSIKLQLVRGENDDHLKWPFQPVLIEVQILNQTSDIRHLSTCIFDTYSRKYACKGNRKSVAIEKLKKKYTVEDTLFFRVIVHEAPTLKPWLVCTV